MTLPAAARADEAAEVEKLRLLPKTMLPSARARVRGRAENDIFFREQT